MSHVINPYTLLQERAGKKFETVWADHLNLLGRLSQVSHDLFVSIREAYCEAYGGTNPRKRFNLITESRSFPNSVEILLFCKFLHCKQEEFLNPAFSFRDREMEMREKKEVEDAAGYGLNLDAAA